VRVELLRFFIKHFCGESFRLLEKIARGVRPRAPRGYRGGGESLSRKVVAIGLALGESRECDLSLY
jgi:hypothetical protein